MVQGIKVVSAKEMQRLEKMSASAHVSSEQLMDRGSKEMAQIVKKWLTLSSAPETVVLLVGKGMKGADALTVGTQLLRERMDVKAILVYPEKSLKPLTLNRMKAFKKAGGVISSFDKAQGSLLIDGIVGTGFQKKSDTAIEHAIEWTRQQKMPILSIDIPSGLDPTSGEVPTKAIVASMTCSMGLPKIGCFINEGWKHVGAFFQIDLGIPPHVLSSAKPEAFLLENHTLSLPSIERCRHKYEAGYVLSVSGSNSMPGAALLASEASLRSGAGIVRVMSTHELALSIPEVIHEKFHLKSFLREKKRASSLLIGPGIGRSKEAAVLFKRVISLIDKPAVIDGDGLFHLAHMKKYELPPATVLTPHTAEMTRLMGEAPNLSNCREWAKKHQVTLVLKGAPTLIFTPKHEPLIMTAGDPGMATAGSGDVLAGIITSFLAQKMSPFSAAALGTYVHGRAGELASEAFTSYSLMARDLIHYLPQVFKEMEKLTD